MITLCLRQRVSLELADRPIAAYIFRKWISVAVMLCDIASANPLFVLFFGAKLCVAGCDQCWASLCAAQLFSYLFISLAL